MGGGTAGLALASPLAEVQTWDVCVLERGPKEGKMYGWSTNSYKWTSPHDPVWLTEPTLRTMETVRGKEKKREWGRSHDLHSKMARHGRDL